MSMERTDAADSFVESYCPIPYRFANSRLVGEFLSCYGWILRNLDVRAGADVLEYGAGEGQICIHLARMGCNVHAIDIEQRFLDVIQKQCDALGIGISTRLARFGDGIDEKLFDRIIFFEAFHHCFDHFDALMRIRELLKPDGFICFSGEPIIAADSEDKIIVPYPWGLRLDGEAMRSISEFGWMELGYSEPYFLELLSRCGYSAERFRCPTYSRGDVYIARKIGSRYPIERDTLISTYKGQSGWHSSEGTHRWTDGDAWFPLPNIGHSTVAVTVENMSPATLNVEISCPSGAERVKLNSGSKTRVVLKLSPPGGNLRIRSGTFRPKSADTRTLGVAVKAIEFQ
jgi:SAM-dependent methyltransferase